MISNIKSYGGKMTDVDKRTIIAKLSSIESCILSINTIMNKGEWIDKKFRKKKFDLKERELLQLNDKDVSEMKAICNQITSDASEIMKFLR